MGARGVGVHPVAVAALEQRRPHVLRQPAGDADVGHQHVKVHLLRVLRVAPARRSLVGPAVSIEGQLKRTVRVLGYLQPVLADHLHPEQGAVEVGKDQPSLPAV